MLIEDRLLGHYRLVRRIGGGGMGEVYLAEDTRIDRQVAVKVVRTETEPYPDPITAQDTARLFHREMRAITMLDHPHILPLFDFGEEKDGNNILTYMVMPLRREGSLTDWLQKRGNSQKLTPNEVAHFVMQAADALQHAHDHHLIHQDIKPSNFLVRERSGHVLPDLLLMDFGIAKITTAIGTTSQNIRGTPAFMAPEQWEGQPQPATDQYALAVMAYQLLTGRTPFSGRMEQVMRQHFTVQPQPSVSLNPAVPPALDAVILRALEKEPAKRFPSILEFAQAFQQALQFTGNQEATVISLRAENTPIRLPLSLQTASPPSVTDKTEFVSARHIPPVSSRKFVLPRSAIIIGLIALMIIGGLTFALVKSNENASPTVVATPVPTSIPHCTHYQLSILDMNVSKISDGFGLGGTLETTWTFSVNDQAQTYDENDLDVGVTNIGLEFLADVPTDTSTITFSSSGKEHDVVSDDDLPGFTQVWGQTQNWGLGFQSVSGTNSSITYTLNYQIACA
jgi:serine/threonine protein kinase